mmetsp:Transcript_32198/g.102507  ORF Transcript_32198/g.102507 Transcript_32198/m.102507 type:complete len:85 (+) Transcript_32198:684-938(+)
MTCQQRLRHAQRTGHVLIFSGSESRSAETQDRGRSDFFVLQLSNMIWYIQTALNSATTSGKVPSKLLPCKSMLFNPGIAALCLI